MSLLARFISFLLLLSLFSYSELSSASGTLNIPILCYHDLNPTKPGSMNMTPQQFETQLKWLRDNGFTVIALQQAVEYLQGTRASLPKKSVVITADDGWQSVYTYMYPLVRKYNMPVTLFIYPEAISKGKNTMTWDDLKKLQQTGLFDIQSHTYWHPNFKQEKRRLSPAAFEGFVKKQLVTSKNILDEKLGIHVTLLAWPFGIYNTYLEQQAKNAGYVMAFSIDHRAANKHDRPMAEPRFMIIASHSLKTFAAIVNQASAR